VMAAAEREERVWWVMGGEMGDEEVMPLFN
jgi:hypothetical protein